MELMSASNQWANRPADERFESIEDLARNAREDHASSIEADTDIRNLEFGVDENDGELVLQGKGQAILTNFAMQQLLTKIAYPVRGLIDSEGGQVVPTDLAANILNHRIKEFGEDNTSVKLYLRKPSEEGGRFTVKSVTSDKYARVPDTGIMESIRSLSEAGWRVPPARPVNSQMPGVRPATEEDVFKLNAMNSGGLAVRVGDPIAPAGLYRGDRDMFTFLVNEESGIDDDNGNGLMRILFIQNSEVGYRSFKITEALCQTVCGNHIVWGATDVIVQKYRHIGDAYDKIHDTLANLTERLAQPRDLTREFEVMRWMRTHEIGTDRKAVVDSLYKATIKGISKKDLTNAYRSTERYQEDGDPNTWMGMANGLTRYSQTLANADQRVALDESAGKLFDIAVEAMA